jgi:hypothetical protein
VPLDAEVDTAIATGLLGGGATITELAELAIFEAIDRRSWLFEKHAGCVFVLAPRHRKPPQLRRAAPLRVLPDTRGCARRGCSDAAL